ncbi:MAG: hypothetical protein IT371_10815 [Deltaproteobacteria bacterium]|nr:hypothetical protein [Deltaproteobacteria bacterium]
MTRYPWLGGAAAVLATAWLGGCSAHLHVAPGEGNLVTSPGVLGVWADWIKEKRDGYDVRLNLISESQQVLMIHASQLRCFRGRYPGVIHSRHLERRPVLLLGPRARAVLVLHCRFNAPVPGAPAVEIARVHENPSGDGMTPGQVLAQDLRWEAGGGGGAGRGTPSATPPAPPPAAPPPEGTPEGAPETEAPSPPTP